MKWLITLIVITSVVFAIEPVDKLENKYIEVMNSYKTEYDNKCRKLTLAYIRELEKLQLAATQKGDLDNAIKIKAKVTEIKQMLENNLAPERTVLTQYKGLYQITYDNGTVDFLQIANNGVFSIRSIAKGKAQREGKVKVNHNFTRNYLMLQRPDGRYNFLDFRAMTFKHTWLPNLNDVKSNGVIYKIDNVDIVGYWLRVDGKNMLFGTEGIVSANGITTGVWYIARKVKINRGVIYNTYDYHIHYYVNNQMVSEVLRPSKSMDIMSNLTNKTELKKIK